VTNSPARHVPTPQTASCSIQSGCGKPIDFELFSLRTS
jgi:hypothetical protein